MGEKYEEMEIEQYKKVFSVLSKCMDDYLFIYDIQKDYFMIDPSATQCFCMEKAEFSNAVEVLRSIVHPEDFILLQEDLREIASGEKTEHNLEYRWLNWDKHSVWISCRGQVVVDEQKKPRFLVGRIMEIDKKGKIDGITGLYREESLKRQLAAYAQEEKVSGYLLQIGIDNFKEINEKYGLEKGDVFVVEDEEAKMHYAFTVHDITQYATSFYIFMDIDCIREMFGEDEDYYNQVFSDKELDIPTGRLYGVTTKKDIEKSADVFIQQMMPMVVMMTVVSSLILAVVMYLMMKVMIDRCAFHISMVKVFGYRTKEIKKLYLDGNFYVIAVGAAICIPLAKKCMDLMYPLMVSNVNCGMNLHYPWQLYAIVYISVLVLYFVMNGLLTSKLKKVNLAEVLKNRE